MSKEIVLSFSDCWQAVKRARWLILLSALFFGVSAFAYFLMKDPTFTAEGIFKGSPQSSATGISKALELLGGGESYSSNDDPKVFLRSYPVMEEVVKSLHLQLNIREKRAPKPLRRIWNTLKAERAQRLLKKKRTESPIPLKEPVSSEVVLEDREILLQCAQLEYPQLLTDKLLLVFLDASRFQVSRKKDLLGTGELGKPFRWEGGNFVLNSTKSLEGKSFYLTFIPLHAAAKSLENSISVKRSKNHNSIVHISFTHRDRNLTANVVNTTMEAFQKYLQDEGKRKISKQLGYLRQRQDESLEGLEAIMEERKAYLEAHLDSGELFLLENELQFMAARQTKARSDLDHLSAEMQAIHQILTGQQTIVFARMLEKLREKRPLAAQTLTIDGARTLIREQEQAIERVRLEQEQYDYCLAKLEQPDFDTSSLSKLIDDSTLKSRFDKIHDLHRNLIDERNWTSREREQLQEQLITEREFLAKHLRDLKKGAELKDEVLRAHLRELQEAMLFLLLDRYEGIEESLRDLALKASHFPEKWLAEQKIELNTNLHTEIIESITKMIEAKNIGYHLEYLASSPLMRAPLPVIPNSPKLLFGFLAGSFLGGFLILVGIFFREVRLGPTASYANLKGEGKQVLSYSHTFEDLKKIHYHLKSKGRVLSILAKNPSFAFDLAALFSKGNEKILMIDLSKNVEKETWTETVYGQNLAIGAPEGFKEVVLGSSSFLKALEKHKADFDRILILSVAPFDHLEVRLALDLADQALVMLRDERWSRLPTLSESTLFVTEAIKKTPLSLSELIPFLERVTSFSSWERTKKRHLGEPPQSGSRAL
ncbi:MAG: hypothetical protein JJU12_07695 [Chlamydiales bacterium]|nr:hypothetical protein [Chlamydiales bacterium]